MVASEEKVKPYVNQLIAQNILLNLKATRQDREIFANQLQNIIDRFRNRDTRSDEELSDNRGNNTSGLSMNSRISRFS